MAVSSPVNGILGSIHRVWRKQLSDFTEGRKARPEKRDKGTGETGTRGSIWIRNKWENGGGD